MHQPMTRLGYATVLVLFLLLFGGGYFIYTSFSDSSNTVTNEASLETLNNLLPSDRVEELTIQSGETFGITLERAGFDTATSSAIVLSAEDVYDLASIRAGNMIFVIFDGVTERLNKIIYEIDSNEELVITPTSDESWNVERIPIEYKIEIAQVKGSISSSLYNAAKELGADDPIIIELATVYQWTIDFGVDTQQGDTFNFIYEKRYRNGEYVDTGRVLAASYTTRGKTYNAFFYDEDKENIGYFDENGASLKREFLKAPVEFRYISSGFTTGSRYVKAFNVSTGHRAIDYAAPYGTPVRSVGNGTVVSAGWNGSYGNFISIRHNDTYTTNYAHLSRIQVSRGQKVSQGEIIGNVGSTGFSTGPHLHYEMVKFDKKINPLREEFPPREPVAQKFIEAYSDAVTTYTKNLKLTR
jgi:murein DD-endopeptidase MepM/ murein hydrolase activator NlpD